MTLETHDYGLITYEEDDLLEFPDGLFGFPELKYYLPLSLCEDGEEDGGVILLLQSTQDINVSFAVINPLVFVPDYAPVLTSDELSHLGVENGNEISFYVICIVQTDYLENTVNLKCPLAINSVTRTGMQVVLDHPAYGYRHKLRSFSRIFNSTTAEEGPNKSADSQT